MMAKGTRSFCARPDVMRRSALRATRFRIESCAPALAARLDFVLQAQPVLQPELHARGRESAFLWLDLSAPEIEAIADAVAEVEVRLASDTKSRARTAQCR